MKRCFSLLSVLVLASGPGASLAVENSIFCPTYLAPNDTAFERPPLVPQYRGYNCGPAALRSWLRTQGFWANERKLSRLLETKSASGTAAKDFVRGIQQLGFRAKYETAQTIDALRDAVARGKGVIVNIQLDGGGHWALVTSVDHESVEMMDPWIARLGRYQRVSRREFLENWYGTDDGPQGAIYIEPRSRP